MTTTFRPPPATRRRPPVAGLAPPRLRAPRNARARRPPARRPPTPPRRAARPLPPGGRDPRRRLLAFLVVVFVAFAGLVVRLVDVQVVSAGRYSNMGQLQRIESRDLVALRGSVLDRNGAPLAISVRRVAVWADPRLVTDPRSAARDLAAVLAQDEDDLYERLTSDGSFVYLARQVEEETAEEVRQLGLAGIGDDPDAQRVEPAGGLARPVVGSVGADHLGRSGLERQYEEVLAGTPGRLVVERGATGDVIADGVRHRDPPVAGSDIHLTIDRDLQWGVERALADQIEAANAKGGLAVVADPVTGEILAMVSLEAGPGGRAAPSDYNQALVDVFEPGSVTKIVTLAGALEEGAIERDTHFNVPDRLRVHDTVFSDAGTHPDRWWAPADILAHSSNVGTIFVGERLGAAGLEQYLERFGFTGTTGLGFPGEASGLVPPLDRWSGTTMATLSMGQGLAVNAVQVLAAYNAIANGGEYVAPTLVQRVVDADGAEQALEPPARRRVVSAETARAVAAMLEQVVVRGTGTAAAVEGYSVAGKTGTASKVVEGVAGYKDGAYMASFAGFVPADAPRLSAVVVLDEPTPYTGSQAAAPVFAEIARYALRHLGIPPSGAAAPAATLASSVTRP